MHRLIESLLIILVLTFPAAAATASVTIGSGSSMNFADSSIDFGCQDLVVAGQAGGSAGTLNSIANLTIAGGGNLAPGSSAISLGGDFANIGRFVPGTSRVAIVDVCGGSASRVSGATAFYDFITTTTSAKQLILPAGATQSITHVLTLHGAAGNLLGVVSSTAGVHAVLSVGAAATQTVDYVNARDNTASAATIAPGTPAQYSSVDGGGLVNWFGATVDRGGAPAAPAPLFDTLGRVVLLLGFLLIAMWTNRFTRKSDVKADP